MASTATKLVKRTIDYPEQKVPTTTTKEWIEENITSRSPREEVRFVCYAYAVHELMSLPYSVRSSAT